MTAELPEIEENRQARSKLARYTDSRVRARQRYLSVSKSPLRVDTYRLLIYSECVAMVHKTVKSTRMKWITGLSKLPGDKPLSIGMVSRIALI